MSDDEQILESLLSDLTNTLIITVIDEDGCPIRIESNASSAEVLIATLVKAVIYLGLEGVVREMRDDEDGTSS